MIAIDVLEMEQQPSSTEKADSHKRRKSHHHHHDNTITTHIEKVAKTSARRSLNSLTEEEAVEVAMRISLSGALPPPNNSSKRAPSPAVQKSSPVGLITKVEKKISVPQPNSNDAMEVGIALSRPHRHNIVAIDSSDNGNDNTLLPPLPPKKKNKVIAKVPPTDDLESSPARIRPPRRAAAAAAASASAAATTPSTLPTKKSSKKPTTSQEPPYVDHTITLFSTRAFKRLVLEISKEREEAISKQEEDLKNRIVARKSINSLTDDEKLELALKMSLGEIV